MSHFDVVFILQLQVKRKVLLEINDFFCVTFSYIRFGGEWTLKTSGRSNNHLFVHDRIGELFSVFLILLSLRFLLNIQKNCFFFRAKRNLTNWIISLINTQ